MNKIMLGTSDFKEIIDRNYYFIDKTLIIKEFIEDSGKIVLLPRPRRFGKTLNLSILRCFFEKTFEERLYLFNGLKIEKETEIMKKQGAYPLIYLTFKDDKHASFENFIDIFRHKVSSIYLSFKYLINNLDNVEKEYFNNILYRKSSISELEISILKLSEYLNDYYNIKVIILIDEYDTPIHEGHFREYYSEIIGFMRNLLCTALKDNNNLEKAMITGILRVAKESIFSGLNNLKVYTLLNEEYSKSFGFTEKEIGKMLTEFNCDNQINNFKNWYNGYIFGSETIYNPWSTLYYLSEKNKEFKPFWVNTSENSIIKLLLAKGNEDIKLGLESLYNGGFIETTINEDIVMSEISNGNENIWSFLLLSGYLKAIEKYKDEEDELFIYRLSIPNKEIKILYKDIIKNWFKESFVSDDFSKMLKALVIGEIQLFEEYFSEYVIKSFSYFDISGENPERVYHAFILGMLVSLSATHEIVSNRESGLGRYDVSLLPKDINKNGIIMEFKSIRPNSKNTLESEMKKALNQVNKKLYDTELKVRGVKNIIKIALVFKGKEVLIKELMN